jgi:RNA polymerase primary sigma factor
MEDVSIESGVDKALARLSQRERRVVELRFGIGCERAHIYSEIATELGVSLERVRQILVRAITKLRAPELHRLLQPLIG